MGETKNDECVEMSHLARWYGQDERADLASRWRLTALGLCHLPIEAIYIIFTRKS